MFDTNESKGMNLYQVILLYGCVNSQLLKLDLTHGLLEISESKPRSRMPVNFISFYMLMETIQVIKVNFITKLFCSKIGLLV